MRLVNANLAPLYLNESACEQIKNMPTVDAVEVVRCRHCKHFDWNEMECENEAVSNDHEGGASYSLNFGPEDFCSYGERKGGAEDG